MAPGHEHPDAPAPFLVENVDLLTPGPVLDVAMGAGRNALYLAEQGFAVTGVDNSPEALRAAQEGARVLGVTLDALLGDLEGGYGIPAAAFQTIICFNYLHRPLLPALRAALCPGGIIVYETYIVDQTRFGPPRNPDHLLRYNELLDFFRDYRCLRYHEGIYENRKAVAGIVAMKPSA
jgi:tellurite methyltransferase